jgi:nitrite reductase/ring-hydroxylating ferredoxin subunit
MHMPEIIDPRDRPAPLPEMNPQVEQETRTDVYPQNVHEKQQWREEFPYHWAEDDVVTRRDTLRFLVLGSGGLFAATGLLAILGYLPEKAGTQAIPIAKVGELSVNESKVFDFPDHYNQGILINLPGKGLVAYNDACTHLSCAVVYQGNGQMRCPCHDGYFDAVTGNVLAGPPTRPLSLIQLAVKDGTVYAVKQIPR